MKYVIFLVALFLSSNTLASGNGKVANLLVGRLGNQVFVKLNGSVDSVACRTRTDWHYFLDLSSPGGKEIFSTLLAAKASGAEVRIQSSGSCDSAGQGLELLSYVILN